MKNDEISLLIWCCLMKLIICEDYYDEVNDYVEMLRNFLSNHYIYCQIMDTYVGFQQIFPKTREAVLILVVYFLFKCLRWWYWLSNVCILVEVVNNCLINFNLITFTDLFAWLTLYIVKKYSKNFLLPLNYFFYFARK